MRLGAVFPTHHVGNDRGAIRDLAQGVEALGFDHLVAYDHVLGAVHEGRDRRLAGPYDERDEFHEPFVLLGHLGALTERIELVVGVLVAPQRQTALVAKQAAEVQALSGGRLRLGVGTGWNWVEYESLGAPFEERGEVLAEQVELLRRLWREPVVSFDGRFHTVDRAGIAPLPDDPIPLWFGGYAPPALRRSAALGDGHLFGHLRPSTIEGAATLRSLVAAAGRPADAFGLEAIADVDGDPDHWLEDAAAWREAGGTHLTVRTIPTAGRPDPGLRTVDDHLGAFERWRREVAGPG
jgi:probable F420-dependent oxidoreductase